MSLFQGLWELLFPPKCVLCRGILEREELDLCRKCRQDTPRYLHRRERIRFVKDYTAVWYYEDMVRESLLRYKFHNARSYCAAYGRMTAMRIGQDLPQDIDLVTWVPVGPKRRLERGYDQVELLAAEVSRELKISQKQLLVKRKDNPPQSGIDSTEGRRANVLGFYELFNRDSVEGRNVLLLDDIITTGATISECARMLHIGGAKNVYCAAVAAGRNQKQ